MFDTGDLDWLVKQLRTKGELLDRSQELAVTEDVRALRDWCSVRDNLQGSLGRAPTSFEWATALNFTDAELVSELELKKQARRCIIQSNLRLVVSIAAKFQNRGVPLHDLVQEGTIGLITAAERFEPSKGWRFSTYATYWIKQSIRRAIYNYGQPIRLPVYMAERLHDIRKARAIAYYSTGRNPEEEVLAAQLQLSDRKMMWARQAAAASRGMLSLEAPASGNSDKPLSKVVADASRHLPSEACEEAEVAEAVRGLLADALSAQEREVVERKYGLGGHDPHTNAQIGAALGASDANEVASTLQRAMRKLRREATAPAVAEALGCEPRARKRAKVPLKCR